MLKHMRLAILFTAQAAAVCFACAVCGNTVGLASLPIVGHSMALGTFTSENSANTLGIFLFFLESELLAPHQNSGRKNLSLQARCWSSERQDTDQPWGLESEMCVFEE